MFNAPHKLGVGPKAHDTAMIDSIITDIVMKMNAEINSGTLRWQI